MAAPEEDRRRQVFQVTNIGLGGIGGRPGKDGSRPRPSLRHRHHPGRGDRGAVPALVQAQAISRRLSGGAGEFRGGLSQVIEIASREAAPFLISAATFDRLRNPAQGRHGGRPGRNGAARRGSGEALPDQGLHAIPPGDSVVLELPGGGGFGEPRRRERERVRADLEAGVISPGAARRDYDWPA